LEAWAGSRDSTRPLLAITRAEPWRGGWQPLKPPTTTRAKGNRLNRTPGRRARSILASLLLERLSLEWLPLEWLSLDWLLLERLLLLASLLLERLLLGRLLLKRLVLEWLPLDWAPLGWPPLAPSTGCCAEIPSGTGA
jgi:hypothetical protein